MKMMLIGDSDTVLAFALAGVQGLVVQSEADLSPILDSLDAKEIGLILITEIIAERNRALIDGLLMNPEGPLVLEIPDSKGPLAAKRKLTDQVASLLRR